MGVFIRRNLKYQMHLLWKSAAVTAVLFVFLAIYWNMMAGDAPDMVGQPFFTVITVLIPFTLSYQYAALYLNIALGACNTRRSAFAAAQIVKLISAVIFTLLGSGADALSVFLVTGRAAVEPMQCAVTALLIIFVMSAGELLGHFTHRFGKIGAILFGIFCGLTGGVIGFFISYTAASDTAALAAPLDLTIMPVWVYLLFALFAVGFPVLVYFCFLRKYGVK